MELNNKQVKQLRALGHSMSPVVTIGQHGMKDSIHEEIGGALTFHQLIKLKINLGDRDERDALISEIAEHHACQLVQRIGNVALLYRRNTEKPSVLP